jgi:hypothetical protein
VGLHLAGLPLIGYSQVFTVIPFGLTFSGLAWDRTYLPPIAAPITRQSIEQLSEAWNPHNL